MTPGLTFVKLHAAPFLWERRSAFEDVAHFDVALAPEMQMFTPPHRLERSASAIMPVDAGLFGWSGGGIVLFGEVTGDRWIVVRGWLGQDKLTDVRRWSFADARAFGGQVRRLALEATGDPAEAATAGAAAADWAASLP